MPQITDIEWTDYSSNPLKLRLPDGRNVNACIKCSPGCHGCYAEAITRRWWRKGDGKFPGYSLPLMKKGEIILDEKELRRLLTFKPKPPFKNGERPSVFVMDMGDIFGSWVPFDLVDQLFAVFALRPDVDFQILTKRVGRMAEYMNRPSVLQDIFGTATDAISAMDVNFAVEAWLAAVVSKRKPVEWPLVNVHIGVSIEDHKRLDDRAMKLAECPAVVPFWSVEPLLETLGNIRGYLEQGVKWVIVGGESGPSARPFDVAWARSIILQCREKSVPVFVKQLGAHVIDSDTTSAGHFPDEKCWPDGTKVDGHRVMLKDKKGGVMSEWPLDLRVREMPTLEVASA